MCVRRNHVPYMLGADLKAKPQTRQRQTHNPLPYETDAQTRPFGYAVVESSLYQEWLERLGWGRRSTCLGKGFSSLYTVMF